MLKLLSKQHLILLCIIFLAFVLRISGLEVVPPSLNWDEVSHGYNAYSILKTGKDEWGKTFPIIFRAYGDYKLPVYIYATTISEFFFGVTLFAVRLPSVLAGVGSVVFTYLLILELFKNRKIALMSALLLAIEPWGLFLSRVAVEANLSLFFIISGTYFLLSGIKKTSMKFTLGMLLMGLSLWTYNSARVFVPLFLLSFIIIYRKDFCKNIINKKHIFIPTLLFALILFVPMFLQLANIEGQARYSNVGIIDEGAISQIINSRNNSNLPGILPRTLNNKVAYFIKIFTKNYISHYSPNFLFIKGGSHYQFNVPERGLLYIINLPFFAIGILYVLSRIKKKNYQLILVWLLIGPIASSLTRETPHALRSIVLLPVPMFISALGIVSIYKSLHNYKKYFGFIFILIYFILISINLENYLIDYSDNYHSEYSWAWQYGYKESVDYIKENYDKYDKIIFSKKYGEPHEFVLFFWPWSPNDFQNDPNLIRFNQSKWDWVDGFDKFYFVNDWQMPQEGEVFVLESDKEVSCDDTHCLLITSPNNFPTNWNKIKTIKFLDDTSAFEIYEN